MALTRLFVEISSIPISSASSSSPFALCVYMVWTVSSITAYRADSRANTCLQSRGRRTLGSCDSSPADACAPCGLDEASTRMVKMAQILPNSTDSEPAQQVFDKMSEPIPKK